MPYNCPARSSKRRINSISAYIFLRASALAMFGASLGSGMIFYALEDGPKGVLAEGKGGWQAIIILLRCTLRTAFGGPIGRLQCPVGGLGADARSMRRP